MSEEYKRGFWAGQHSIILPSTKKQITKQTIEEFQNMCVDTGIDYDIVNLKHWLDEEEE